MKGSGFCYLHLEAKLMGMVGAPRPCCLNSAGGIEEKPQREKLMGHYGLSQQAVGYDDKSNRVTDKPREPYLGRSIHRHYLSTQMPAEPQK